MSNTEVYKRTKARKIADYLSDQQIKWYGHVIRMDNTRLQKILLFEKLSKERRLVCGLDYLHEITGKHVEIDQLYRDALSKKL